jgi:hypothetical protein
MNKVNKLVVMIKRSSSGNNFQLSFTEKNPQLVVIKHRLARHETSALILRLSED